MLRSKCPWIVRCKDIRVRLISHLYSVDCAIGENTVEISAAQARASRKTISGLGEGMKPYAVDKTGDHTVGRLGTGMRRRSLLPRGYAVRNIEPEIISVLHCSRSGKTRSAASAAAAQQTRNSTTDSFFTGCSF